MTRIAGHPGHHPVSNTENTILFLNIFFQNSRNITVFHTAIRKHI